MAMVTEMESTGCQDQISVLYHEFSGMIYSLCYQMTGSREDAEDLVQKTFLQAYLSIDSFRKDSKVSTWLFTIAKNLCCQYLNLKNRSTFLSFQNLITEHKPEKHDHHYLDIEKDYYVSQVREGCLLGLLRCLPLQQRLAFILHVLLRMEFKTVAQILGKSESATRTLTHRARKSIKGFLCEHCSLYISGNACSCENFIEFSLQRGWIEKPGPGRKPQAPAFEADAIAGEISDLKKIASMYASIPERHPSAALIKRMKDAIENQDRIIFLDKKVK